MYSTPSPLPFSWLKISTFLTPCEEKTVGVFIPAVISNIFPRFLCTGGKEGSDASGIKSRGKVVKVFLWEKMLSPPLPHYYN